MLSDGQQCRPYRGWFILAPQVRIGVASASQNRTPNLTSHINTAQTLHQVFFLGRLWP